MECILFSFTTIHTWPTSFTLLASPPASCLSLRSLLFISTHHHESTHIQQGPTHLAESPSWLQIPPHHGGLLYCSPALPIQNPCSFHAHVCSSTLANISKAVSRMLSLTENTFTSESFNSSILLFF